MEQHSKHYSNTHKWVKKVINSCKTYEQVNTCHKIIELWENKTVLENPKINGYEISMMYSELDYLIEYKLKTLKTQ
jgi:hypothetical protein